MSIPKVFVTRILPQGGMDMIHAFAEAEVWQEELPPPYDALRRKVEGADGLVCLLTDRIDADLIESAADSLRVISQMAVGYDNIDIEAATRNEIPVGNTPGVLTDTTADFAFTLMMAAARRIVEAQAFVKAGKWKTWGPTLLMGHDIHNATLGIIGFGRIGRAVATRARGFNMRVLYFDPEVEDAIGDEHAAERVSLEKLLAESDFVSLHVPLTQQTKHMISGPQLKMMKPSAVLVNTSRGSVVDLKALYEALTNEEISYAALDVTEPEPIHEDDPLLSLDNCIVVPHIASSSLASRTKMATMAAENLKAGLNAERLPHCVNPEVYGKQKG